MLNLRLLQKETEKQKNIKQSFKKYLQNAKICDTIEKLI